MGKTGDTRSALVVAASRRKGREELFGWMNVKQEEKMP